VLLLFPVIGSALQRMRLYQGEFGLTESRFYATALIVWLGVVLVWFALTVLRGRPARFAWGTPLSGLAAVALLNVMDPDARIARVNVAHAAGAQRLDTDYLALLSADAVPVLAPAIAALPARDVCHVAIGLLLRHDEYRAGQDWRSWNHSRARAERLLAGRAAALESLGCLADRPQPRHPDRQVAPPPPRG
jgi:hypothetical protein